jgi:hypothetical protein
LSGKDPSSYFKYVVRGSADDSALNGSDHQLIRDLKDKAALFDSASAKFSVAAA